MGGPLASLANNHSSPPSLGLVGGWLLQLCFWEAGQIKWETESPGQTARPSHEQTCRLDGRLPKKLKVIVRGFGLGISVCVLQTAKDSAVG